MYDQLMTSSSLPINVILVTGERELRGFVSPLKEGGSLGQKIVGFHFPLRKMDDMVVVCIICGILGAEVARVRCVN